MGMRAGKGLYISLTAAILAVSLLFSLWDPDSSTVRYHQHREQSDEESLGAKPESDGLVTHLPVVEIDTSRNGQKQTIPGKAVLDDMMNVVGESRGENGETEIRAKISTIEKEGEWHDSNGEPDVESDILIHVRGNSSRAFDKSNYRIKLIKNSTSSEKQELSLLGMKKSGDWILHGPFLDKL